MAEAPTHRVRVLIDATEQELEVPHGANLRRALLNAGISPYAPLAQRVNCGGRGLCATCGVWIEEHIPAPQHWHDRLAAHFGYPRLSCQIQVMQPMTIRIMTDKRFWGSAQKGRRWRETDENPGGGAGEPGSHAPG
ncbi:MAG: 2Fe-2S iron-sulfur cluster binding domain-containing protein [Anaerolineae bacterium]|nr:2Fe-2S iron-sulfur cluster binding domain-containing protein [Anaerolineae bacterium]